MHCEQLSKVTQHDLAMALVMHICSVYECDALERHARGVPHCSKCVHAGYHCQGSEGPWHTMVLRDGSQVAEHVSICPSAYETSHDIMPVVNRGGCRADGCTLLVNTGIVQEKGLIDRRKVQPMVRRLF